MKTKNSRLFRRIWWMFLLLTLFFSLSSFPVFNMETAQAQEKIQQHSEQHAENHDNHAGHGDEIAPIYIIFCSLIFGAVFGRFLARLIKQPAVLGELVIGVIIGTILYQAQFPTITIIRHQDEIVRVMDRTVNDNVPWVKAIEKEFPPVEKQTEKQKALIKIMNSPNFGKYLTIVIAVKIFSALGVILLLFMVGIECSFQEMLHVGAVSFWAAIIGIVVPFILGYVVSYMLMPNVLDQNVHIFMGSTLCATSIGITARVFRDMNKLQIPEAKVVMGAAVLDDILGLIILAVVAGIISEGKVEALSVGLIIVKALIFLGVTIFIGEKILGKYMYDITFLDRASAKILFTFSFMLLLAWISDYIGLASIVGAFAAGLILKDSQFSAFDDHIGSLEHAIMPIEAIFSPIFFVMMGMQIDVRTFADPQTLQVALALTVVAIIGKMVAGVVAKEGMDPWIIGVGLVPRGEVGLIFASIGKSLGVLNENLFSIVIIVVILTTFVTPPALKWVIDRSKDRNKKTQKEDKNTSEEKKSAPEENKNTQEETNNSNEQNNSSNTKKKKKKKKK